MDKLTIAGPYECECGFDAAIKGKGRAYEQSRRTSTGLSARQLEAHQGMAQARSGRAAYVDLRGLS